MRKASSFFLRTWAKNWEAALRSIWIRLRWLPETSNPVAGPFFNFSVPEPTGVVGVVAPQSSSLLGLLSVLAPVLVTGNTAVLLASEARPLPAVLLTEVLATSDLPGGVVNLITGRVAELAPVLAAHRDVDALDLAGAPTSLLVDIERAAVTNVKRVLRPDACEPDWTKAPTPRRMLAFLESNSFRSLALGRA